MRGSRPIGLSVWRQRVAAQEPLADRSRHRRLIPLMPRWRQSGMVVTFAADSALEGKGFEPSVPRKAPGILAASALVRGVFPLAGNQAEAT
jgi:hypothetical protein